MRTSPLLLMIPLLLAQASIESHLPSAIRAHAQASDAIEVEIGHGYAGSESFAMSGDRVIHTQNIADASGEVNAHRSILHPNAKVWKRFWLRVDEANVWQWTFRYSDISRGQPMGGVRWRMELHHGEQSVVSTGYNSAPKNFGDLQAALDQLVAESAVDASDP